MTDFEVAPDLVLVVIAPNDLATKVNSMVEHYLADGVAQVGIILPKSRIIIRADGSGNLIQQGDQVTRQREFRALAAMPSN